MLVEPQLQGRVVVVVGVAASLQSRPHRALDLVAVEPCTGCTITDDAESAAQKRETPRLQGFRCDA